MDRLFLLEDDRSLIDGLKYSLEKNGFRLTVARTVGEAMERLERTEDYDLLLLDVSLPDGTGFDVCRQVRAQDADIPIIFLTAADEETNVIRGLDGGGDDYITKPFRIRELLARMKAILRRTSGAEKEAPQLVTVGKNQVNLRIGKVYCGNEEVLLTAMEYRLLLIFLNHRGQVLSRGQILDQIWDGAGEFVNDNTLTVYVGRLRKKLGDTEKEPLIETVRGAGYRLRQ